MADTQTEERRSDTKRIQFEFPQEAVDRLNRMRDQTGATSYAEVVRNALRMYEWFLDQQADNYDIGLVRDDKLVKTIKFVF